MRDAIVRLGHEVTLIAPPASAHETTLSRLIFNLKARSRLRNVDADVIVGFDLDGVFLQRPHIAAIKGVLADEATFEHGRSRLALAVQARLESRHVRRAERIITTSRYSSERIVRFYGVDPPKIIVVPELIDLQTWRSALQSAPREEGVLRVLCVAHLYPRKSVDTLLHAFAQLKGDAMLRIVGIGPEKRRLERLAPDRVQFLGQLPFKDLIAEYRNATVFALPTSQEGFGIVFLEAMAASLPIVAGDAAAVPEVVRDGGILVKPGDPDALARALQRLIDEPETRKAMGAAGCAEVRRYDAPIVARQFLEAIGIRSD